MGKGLLLGTLEFQARSEPAEIEPTSRGLPLVHGEKPEPWFTFAMPNKDWHFCWVSESVVMKANNGDMTYAVTFPSEGIVILDRALQAPKMLRLRRIFTFHEITHIGLYKEGDPFCRGLARTEAAANSREEYVCSTLSDVLATPLAAAGIFRLPALRRRR